MLNKREIFSILLVTIILAFAFSIKKFTTEILLYTLLSVFLIIIINIAAKKITSHYFESEIEIKLWEIKRYGLMGISMGGFRHPDKKFKHPFPAGIFFPMITAALSLGNFIWMSSFIFNVKAKIHRAAKRHGLYSFSEMTEFHIALIATAGIVANLILAIAGYLAGFETFAKLNIYYAFFNILPISDLDGNKIFFGSKILWSTLATITLLGLAYIFMVV